MTEPMDRLMMADLRKFLDAPFSVDGQFLADVFWWMNPKPVSASLILDALLECEFVETKSEARKLITQNGIRWNGNLVTNPAMLLEYIDGWGVFKRGDRHRMILDKRQWQIEWIGPQV